MSRDLSKYVVSGQPVPSVTEILSIESLYDFAGIAPSVLEKARERGERVHRFLELEDRELGFGDEPTEDIAGYVHGWRRFKRDTGFVADLVESVVVSKRYQYGGQLDRKGSMTGEPRVVVLDIKCVAAMTKATPLQTAGYTLALPEVESGKLQFADVARKGVQLLPAGPTETSPGYKLYNSEDRADLHDWVAAVRLVHWRLRNGLASLEEEMET